jgi:hypothetical protein
MVELVEQNLKWWIGVVANISLINFTVLIFFVEL